MKDMDPFDVWYGNFCETRSDAMKKPTLNILLVFRDVREKIHELTFRAKSYQTTF